MSKFYVDTESRMILLQEACSVKCGVLNNNNQVSGWVNAISLPNEEQAIKAFSSCIGEICNEAKCSQEANNG